MTEKVLFLLFGLLTAALGYFIKERLDEIKTKQSEHSKSLYNMNERMVRVESKQDASSGAQTRIQQSFEVVQVMTRETKSMLDHNLYEMRQDFKKMQDKHYELDSKYGKVIVILQKLLAKTGNGS